VQTGSRIRFNVTPTGDVTVERVLLDLEDLWRMADQGPKAKEVMSFEEMNRAKARRIW
jgi:hypothetical protein